MLAVFLLLLSITLFFFIKLLRKADDAVSSIDLAAAAFRRSITAMPWIRLLVKFITRTRGRKD
jgi:hypothetical protein